MWIVIVGVGIGSFALRVVPLFLLHDVELSERTDRLIRHGGLAAISALVVLSTQQSASGDRMLPTLVAVGLAIVLAARGATMARLLLFGGAAYALCFVASGVIAP